VAFGYQIVIQFFTALAEEFQTLRGLTPEFGSFNDDQFDEVQFEQHLDSNPHLANPACRYRIRKLQARFSASRPYGFGL
jgi:hypothetical protein